MRQQEWIPEFNALGFCLRPQAAKLISSFLETCQDDPESAVETLVSLTKAHLKASNSAFQSIIDEDVMKAVITAAVEGSAADEVDMEVLNGELEAEACIFNVKPFAFNEATKAWDTAVQEPALFPGLYSKARIYQDRFRILHQRLLLQGEFVTEGLGATSLMPGQRKLTSVASLVGNPGRKLSFGLLRREEDESRGRWVIEDLHKVVQVELVLGETRHLVTDGSFVLCEGELLDGIFRVCELHPLKAIPRQVSIEKDQLPVQIPTATMTEHQLKILEAQESSRDGMYVVLSEVHLDSVQVLDMLETLFQGYESAGPPKAYILMGNFCSRSFVPNAQGVRAYREGFERLKFMLRNLEAHVLHGTRFIFIPGPRDPGPQTLPKAPLPNYLTADLARDIPGAVMATNPCHVRHLSREMVFFRHDVLRLLRRHEAVPLARDTQVTGFDEHRYSESARFILDQAHLVPLPLEESNVLWGFDHALRLYPLPHAVFIGGVTPQFRINYEGCQLGSVGPFSSGSFYSFHPVQALLEICDVPDRAG